MFFNAQFIAAGSVMLANALIAFIVSLIYGNHGHIDRTWSVVPAIYAWIFASAYLDVRTATISILITLWAIRLSFNFYRRGGYSGYEDYRWPILRKKIPNILLWQMFNIVFICLYQSVLLFLIAVPVHIAAIAPTPIYWTDMLSIVLFVFFLYTETLADQQQWEFQNKKHEFINSGEQVPEPYSAGFCQEGLFKYSRHPNFFSEQSLWWCVFGISIAPSVFGAGQFGEKFAWSIVGTVLLTLLIIGSTVFTEQLSAEKYPEYKNYQKRVSMLIPTI